MLSTLSTEQAAVLAKSFPAQRPPDSEAVPLILKPPSNEGARRVLHLVDTLNVGGTETQMVEVALRLHSSSYHMTVGCLRAEGPLLEVLQRAGIPVFEFRKGRTLLSVNGIYQLFRLAIFIRRAQFHVVHAHDLWANLLGVPAAWLARTPIIISSRRYLADLDWCRPWRRKVMRMIYGLSTQVVVNSSAIRDVLVESDGVAPDKVRLLYNGVDVDRFAVARGDRKALLPGIASRSKLIAVVANMYGRVKGHACLITAACRVCRNVPNTIFILIGDGEERPKLEEQVREAGLESNFVFLGRRNDVPQLLACCDLSVLPSEAEGLPNSALEAMAAGLPVVATCVGGSSEVIIDGVNGLLVPPGDGQALAEAILRILQDSTLARRLAQAGQQRVRTHFGFDRLIGELEKLYATGQGAHQFHADHEASLGVYCKQAKAFYKRQTQSADKGWPIEIS